MRNAVLATIAVTVLGGCGADRDPNLPQRIAACSAAIDGALAGILDGGVEKIAGTPAGRAAACADLYRRAPCAAAWRKLGDDQTMAELLVPACADAYCPDLFAPLPRACTRKSVYFADRHGVVRDLVELDRAILRFEGVSPDDAAALARRSTVFYPISTLAPIVTDPPPATTATTIRVRIAADAVYLDGEEVTEAELVARIAAAAGTARPKLAVAIIADPQIQYSRVVDLMDAMKRAGVRDFMFMAE